MHTFQSLPNSEQLELAWDIGILLSSRCVKDETSSTTYFLMWVDSFYVELETKQDKNYQVVYQKAIPFKNGIQLDKYLEKITLSKLMGLEENSN